MQANVLLCLAYYGILQAVAAEVEQDTRDGARALVNGTPTFYINGRIMVGAQLLDVFANMIDEELALVAPNEASNDEGIATDGPWYNPPQRLF